MRRHRNGDAGRSRPRFATHSPNAAEAFGGSDVPDATDAGEDFFRRSANRRADQKARQLCRQVYRTLSVALPGLGDEVLQDLTVIAVDPAPDAGHLLVTVSPGGASAVDVPSGGLDVLARLGGASGRLRAEVARDIVRKRAPELSFRLVPPLASRQDPHASGLPVARNPVPDEEVTP
jgi:ribosome-binding factor A